MKNKIIEILEKNNRDTIYSDEFDQIAEEIELAYAQLIVDRFFDDEVDALIEKLND